MYQGRVAGHVAGTKSQHVHTHENLAGACPRSLLQRRVPSCELILL